MTAQELKIREVLSGLPHGSGIDCDWCHNIRRNGNLEFSNSFHLMDEMGGYDGWQDFTVILFRHKKEVLNRLIGPCAGKIQIVHKVGDWDFRIEFNGPTIKRNSVYGLKDYLYDTIGHAIEDEYIGVRHDTIDA